MKDKNATKVSPENNEQNLNSKQSDSDIELNQENLKEIHSEEGVRFVTHSSDILVAQEEPKDAELFEELAELKKQIQQQSSDPEINEFMLDFLNKSNEAIESLADIPVCLNVVGKELEDDAFFEQLGTIQPSDNPISCEEKFFFSGRN